MYSRAAGHLLRALFAKDIAADSPGARGIIQGS